MSSSGPTPDDADDLVRALAASLASDALIDAIMHIIVALSERLGPAVDAASATMRRRGRLITVAATHPVASEFDQLQYDSGSGPCVEAATDGSVVHGYPGTATSPWPALRALAQHAAIHAVLSTPILDAGQPIGALNLYALAQDFDHTDQALASLLVAEAATPLHVTPLEHPDLIRRLKQGLLDRDRIALAQGILMERHHLSADQAYTHLRRQSVTAATSLHDNAAEVIRETTHES